MSTSFKSEIVAPAEEMIPLCVPSIGGNAWDYVKECLDTGWVSSVGSYVDRFEKMVAARLGAAYAVATVNGTSALHAALIVSGVRAGDEVLVSTLTFIATANAARYVGARAVPIDAEARYWQIDPEQADRFCRTQCEQSGDHLVNRRTGRPVTAIIPAHILGHPVDMDALCEVAARYRLKVIEDAAEGLGALYKGRSVGNVAPIGCLSFNGNKLITTGGGGMIVTNDPAWAKRARYLTTQAKDDPLEYVHGELGYNYRLTNLQAALGCSQMEQLDEHIEAKKSIAASYNRLLADIPGITLMPQADFADSASWLYTILIDENQFGLSARQVLAALDARRIQTRPLWQPMHLSPVHAAEHNPACPVADRLYRQGLSLPCSVGMTEAQLHRVSDALHSLNAKRTCTSDAA